MTGSSAAIVNVALVLWQNVFLLDTPGIFSILSF